MLPVTRGLFSFFFIFFLFQASSTCPIHQTSTLFYFGECLQEYFGPWALP